jgi:DnaJ homolog subfamily C member 8
LKVLQIDPEITVDDARKQYRKLSILVHPDKNPDDSERAQKAFDILKKAIEILEDPEKLTACRSIVEEAEARTRLAAEAKKRQLKKEGRPQVVDEDDPERRRKAVYVLTMKLFAERERKRKALEDRAQEETKRQREGELEKIEEMRQNKEWEKRYDETRDERVQTWKSFQAKATKKGKLSKGAFRPPKHKMETRE